MHKVFMFFHVARVSLMAPVTGRAQEQEEKQVDSEGVCHRYDGPFRYCFTGVLQLT